MDITLNLSVDQTKMILAALQNRVSRLQKVIKHANQDDVNNDIVATSQDEIEEAESMISAIVLHYLSEGESWEVQDQLDHEAEIIG